ncbi:MAG: polysaccharide biosynthesis/export family protein [bacterium]
MSRITHSISDLLPPGRIFGRGVIACTLIAGLHASCVCGAESPSAVLSHTQLDLRGTNVISESRVVKTAPSAPYKLGIGDVLSISIYGEEGSARTVPVDPSGRISFSLVNPMQASGRTIDELRSELQQKISKELKYGIVSVVPIHFGSQTFTVLGLVQKPGTYPIEGRMLIMDALGRAGGFRSGYFRNSTADLFDLRHATLLRQGNAVPVDFEALISRGDSTQNMELKMGDILTFPSALVRSVYVLGEVNYPRSIGFVTSLTLVQALTEVKGLKATSNGRMVVVRGSLAKPEVMVVDIQRVLAGKARDIQLSPGDIVYAPRPSFEILADIVKVAISTFAGTVAADSGAQVYRNVRGESGTSTRPIVLP